MDPQPSILGFFGPHRWLSNFHLCQVEFEGLLYSSSEAAYQAAKAVPSERGPFTTMTPKLAKYRGRSVPLPADWNARREQVMWQILLSKFSFNSDLQDKLLFTGDAYLEETNNWGDTFWGVCRGKGQNRLGVHLMVLRRELRLGKVSPTAPTEAIPAPVDLGPLFA